MKLRVLDLFAGIGGFSLGLERTGGFETVAFCEIEKYPQKVLAKHWPGVPIYDDVRELTAERLATDGIGVDVITGGFPCQDISSAGRQAGIGEGTRSGLWSEVARLIGELRPRYAVMENVTALISGDSGRWFGRVLGDLAEVGYDAEWHCIPASELGAHHHRDRVWIVSYPSGRPGQSAEVKRQTIYCSDTCRNGPAGYMAHPDSERLQGLLTPGTLQKWREAVGYGGQDGEPPGWSWATEPGIRGGIDGFPGQLDSVGGLTDAAKANGAETLQAMRGTVWQKAYEWAVRGLQGVSESQILLSLLCEYERRKDTGRMEVESEADAREIMRSLWSNIESSRPSLQPRCDGQFAREYSDALCQLPHNTPSLIPQAWQENIWEDGILRVVNGIPARSHRLKALGNAVVPQIPELIGRAILEANS